MLDFFAVLTKGGLVLFYIQDAGNYITHQLNSHISAINELIQNVILQVSFPLEIRFHIGLSQIFKIYWKGSR